MKRNIIIKRPALGQRSKYIFYCLIFTLVSQGCGPSPFEAMDFQSQDYDHSVVIADKFTNDNLLNEDQRDTRSALHRGAQVDGRMSARKLFYGYYFTATSSINYTSEVSDHTNTVFVRVANPHNLGELSERLRIAKSNGMHVIVHVDSYFFQPDKSGRATLALRSDAHRLWASAVRIMKPYEDHIAAFLLFDEPHYVNMAKGSPRSGVQVAAVINSVAINVKTHFRNKPTLTIFSYMETVDSPSFVIPEQSDWFGVNCYGDFTHCGRDREGGPISMPSYYNILKSRLLPRHKLVLFPQAFTFELSGHEWTLSQEQIAGDVERYYEMMANDHRVVGFFPYLWQSYQEVVAGVPRHVRGAHELPIVRAKTAEIGRRIQKNQSLFHPAVYNADYYRFIYSDLRGMTYDQLAWHWWTYGAAEGRTGSRYLSTPRYLSRYHDLTHAYGRDGFLNAAIHFGRWGYDEGRRGH